MIIPFYLIVSSGKSVRTVKSRPALDWNEIAIHMTIDVPDSLFKRPLIEGKIVISEESIAPREIKPEVLINTAAEIERQTGMKVELKVLSADTKEARP